jgi:cold shock CspA family protein
MSGFKLPIASQQRERGEFEKALCACEELIARFRRIPDSYIDPKIVETLKSGSSVVRMLTSDLYHTELLQRAAACEMEIDMIRPPAPIVGVASPGDRKSFRFPDDSDVAQQFDGIVTRIDIAKKYGFLQYIGGKTVYFHFSDIKPGFPTAEIGSVAHFTVAKVRDKFRAEHISFEEKMPDNLDKDASVAGKDLLGIIKNVPEGKAFGFIYADSGADYFFHRNNLDSRVALDDLRPGLRVSFKLGRNQQGVVATQVRIVN